ncbi:methylthioribose-1-phosphate isomerase [Cryptococcus bacillisporus CA1873]|uniref:Methylthioribose-1-phosphate isomerase n=1 Tax=Cryptococcus bacillisporus CA1873 TaxID=1296111 RepID=A0ABR5BAZ8_CRYGA|nr:methylthioribose-1-phosphate isomerase [Cryptococcus bacillisporus CA1873]|eukprot:KIR62362.1 methylthioribose-1-phosphate isomerase [Cryptococcus gattii CA1873]
MVAAAPSNKKPLPDMMTSIRLDQSGQVEIVDQLLLPHSVVWMPVSTPEEAFNAIKSMRIRGAPAIASLAALTVRSYLNSSSSPVSSSSSPSDVISWVSQTIDYLQSSRPTAVNLGEAMDRIRAALKDSKAQNQGAGDIIERVKKICGDVHDEDLERNMEMGRLGAEWLWKKRGGGKKGLKVVTVCNTGSLATSGYGTAIGVITALFEGNHLDTAYYAQTTPYHQGSRLTSLELTTLQIPACMICDTMLGSLFQHEDIDGVIVGADRVVKNGDTANKIGTYQAAVLAQRHNIPFMVVAPVTTIDLSLSTGAEIHIEHRPAIEATQVRGLNTETGKLSVVRISPEGVGEGDKPWQRVYNPSFDVTPAELISAVVTEKGVAERKEGEKSIDVASIC